MDRIYTTSTKGMDGVRLIIIARRCAALILKQSRRNKWYRPYHPTYSSHRNLPGIITVGVCPYNQTMLAVKAPKILYHTDKGKGVFEGDKLDELLSFWREAIPRYENEDVDLEVIYYKDTESDSGVGVTYYDGDIDFVDVTASMTVSGLAGLASG